MWAYERKKRMIYNKLTRYPGVPQMECNGSKLSVRNLEPPKSHNLKIILTKKAEKCFTCQNRDE